MKTELKNAILEQIGITESDFKENVKDYTNAMSGITGFTYYSDTHEFAIENQNLINELINDIADEYDLNAFEFVSGFGTFKSGLDREEQQDLYLYLSGFKNLEQSTITNTVSWFCVEQLAFELSN